MNTLFEAFSGHVSRRPDATAFVGANAERLTYAELERLSASVAAGLAAGLAAAPGRSRRDAGGCGPIVLIARDGPLTVALALAVARLGLCLAPLNPALGAAQLRTAVHGVSASLVLHDAASTIKAHEAAAEACPALDIRSLADEGATSGAPVTGAGGAGDRWPYLLSFSSGSTGDPKPVVFTDEGKWRRAVMTAAEFEVTGDDTILCASPFFHSLGQRLTFMPLVLGATLVQLPAFSPEAWLEAVDRHRVTFTICVSSHLVALLPALVGDDPRAAGLRALVSSSANIDATTKRALFAQRRFEFFEMYGASEVATATRLRGADLPAKADSVGRACAGVELRILDPEGRPCASGVDGQISVRSPLASPGYLGRPDLDARAFADGWFATGDLGHLDEDGFLYFVDRLSDVIVTGGSNVHPSDVESVVRELPEVEDCIVVGIADAYLGQAVVGVVGGVVADRRATERRLRAHCRTRLASHQQPLAWFFVDRLPTNATGKVDRKSARAHYDAMHLELSSRFAGLGTARAGS